MHSVSVHVLTLLSTRAWALIKMDAVQSTPQWPRPSVFANDLEKVLRNRRQIKILWLQKLMRKWIQRALPWNLFRPCPCLGMVPKFVRPVRLCLEPFQTWCTCSVPRRSLKVVGDTRTWIYSQGKVLIGVLLLKTLYLEGLKADSSAT